MPKNLDLSGYEDVQKKNSSKVKNDKFSTFIKNEAPEQEINKATEKNVKTETSENNETEHRVNMAFTDSNYEFLLSETSKLGTNFMNFLNHIVSSTTKEEIEQLIKEQPWRKGGRSSAPRRRGHKSKRINFKISKENHKKLNDCASNNDATITTIVNVILEIYIAKNNLNIK